MRRARADAAGGARGRARRRRRPTRRPRAERRERVALTARALATLKPAERRALALLAAGLSYAEIGELCGWTYTKVNRCLAEGRAALRERVARLDNSAGTGAAVAAFEENAGR